MVQLIIETNILIDLLYAYVGSSALIATLYTLFSKNSWLKPGVGGLLKVLLAFCLGVIAIVLAIFAKIYGEGFATGVFPYFFISSIGMFILGWFGLFYVYAKSHVRIFHLREDFTVQYMAPLKWLQKLKKKDYELVDPKRRDATDQLSFLPQKLSRKEQVEIAEGYSFLFTGDDEIRLIDEVFNRIFEGIQNGETVNYVCVNKHPIEVWKKLTGSKQFPGMEEKIKANFILIDAYTQNFGFDDEVNEESLKKLERQGVHVVQGKTIPGIHSATAKAFNLTKRQEREKESQIRRPNRMVYDSISTLSFLYGIEAIQVFLSHMIPAEKNYGMWTFVIELSDANPKICTTLRRLVDTVLEFNVENKNEPPVIKKLRVHSAKRQGATTEEK